MRSRLVLSFRLLLGAVFGIGTLTKVLHPSSFAAIIESHYQVPLVAIGVVVSMVVALETALTMALLTGWKPKLMGWASALILLTFTGISVVPWLQGRTVDCGCFPGLLRQSVGFGFLFRNGLLIAASILLAILAPSEGCA